MKKVHGMTIPELFLLALIEAEKQDKQDTVDVETKIGGWFFWEDTQQGFAFWDVVNEQLPNLHRYGLKKKNHA